MVAALLGDEAARQLDHVAPDDRRDQSAGVQRVRKNRQAAQRMIDPGKVFFEVAADLRRRFQARQHIDETEQRHAQRLVVQRPVDHPAQQILGVKQRRLLPRRFLIQRPCQFLDFLF